MMKTTKMSVIFLTVILLFSSCASIVTRSTYALSINSNPTNAAVNVTNKRGQEIYSGNTPATVRLKAGDGYFSKAEYQVKFSAAGYNDRIVPVTFSLDGWYVGNIVFGGLIGMLIVDPATGAMWRIDTEFLNETLIPLTSSVAPEIKIFDINEIPDDWKSKLVQLN